MSAVSGYLAALDVCADQRYYEQFGPSRPLRAA